MLSERLRVTLNERGMTLEELSALSGVPVETIRNLLYQKAENPRLKTILALCQALNTSVEAMVSDHPANQDLQLLTCYHNCSSHGKYLINLIASLESELASRERGASFLRTIPCLMPIRMQQEYSPFSSCSVEEVQTSCLDAFLAIRIPDNEFAPLYCQDDILLLSREYPRYLQHAVFLFEGRLYFRKIVSCAGGYALQSINGKAEPVFVSNINRCRLVGTCIGIQRL